MINAVIGRYTVSWLVLIGMTPALETSPTVGLIPYNAARFPGQIIDPSVSLPNATYDQISFLQEHTGANPELTPTALPELLPQGFPPASNLNQLRQKKRYPPTTYAD